MIEEARVMLVKNAASPAQLLRTVHFEKDVNDTLYVVSSSSDCILARHFPNLDVIVMINGRATRFSLNAVAFRFRGDCPPADWRMRTGGSGIIINYSIDITHVNVAATTKVIKGFNDET